MTAAVLPTTSRPAGADDILFQNLLSAEWTMFSFYQQGVETFNELAFTDLGLPSTTYQRITKIRDNEAGHIPRFYFTSVFMLGPCSHDNMWKDAAGFLALQNIIEVSSMVFATASAQQLACAKFSLILGIRACNRNTEF